MPGCHTVLCCVLDAVNRVNNSPTAASTCDQQTSSPTNNSYKPETVCHRRRRRRLNVCVADKTSTTSDRRRTANERERRRMRTMNEAFDELRAVVPVMTSSGTCPGGGASGRKLSKYDTLQFAQSYISVLVDLLRSQTDTD